MIFEAADFPPHLHKKIMRRVRLVKYRPFFGAGFFLALFSLSSWSLAVKIKETGTLAAISDLCFGFEMSLGFFSDLAAVFFMGIPVLLFSLFMISLSLGSYFGYGILSSVLSKRYIHLNS